MSGDLIPGAVAASGGTALLTAIIAREHLQNRRMRASRIAFAATFPTAATPELALSALGSLAGLRYTNELVAEVVAEAGGIHHLVHVPAGIAPSVGQQLAAALPGLRLDEVTPQATGPVTLTFRIGVARETVLRTEEAVGASRALLAGLSALRDNERVSLRWALQPGGRAPETEVGLPLSSLRARAHQRGLAARQGEPGFSVHGLLLVRAGTPARGKQLAAHVVAVLRSRRGPGHGLTMRRGRVRRATAMTSLSRNGWLSTQELLPLLAWPLGPELIPGVTTGAARRLPVPRSVSRVGRQICIGQDPYGPRPVALTAEAARHHVLIAGPSGVGKSVLLARGVLDDLAAGFGGVVIDPKADLIETILERIPPQHASRVVLLDPAAGGPIPGLDLLRHGDPDLRADVVVGALASIFHGVWGVRSDYYARLAIRTLADVPGATLADLGRLFLDPGYRRLAIAQLRDPASVGAWQAYEALSPAEQMQHVQAPLARVNGLMARPAVRAVLASPDPKLDIGRLLEERKLLLVSLSPGKLGEPAARLISALVMYVVWSAIEARATLPPERRHPVFVTVDELATLAHLPVSFELLAERMRGLGAGLTVALQTLSRVSDHLRDSLLANCASLVTFRAGHVEARRLAAELPLSDTDLMALGRYEVAARIGTGVGGSVVTVTGQTEPLPAPTGQTQAIRERSARVYGSNPLPDADPAAREGQPTDGEVFGRTGSAA